MPARYTTTPQPTWLFTVIWVFAKCPMPASMSLMTRQESLPCTRLTSAARLHAKNINAHHRQRVEKSAQVTGQLSSVRGAYPLAGAAYPLAGLNLAARPQQCSPLAALRNHPSSTSQPPPVALADELSGGARPLVLQLSS